MKLKMLDSLEYIILKKIGRVLITTQTNFIKSTLKLVFVFISLTMKVKSCEVQKNSVEHEVHINLLFHITKKVNGCRFFQFLHEVT